MEIRELLEKYQEWMKTSIVDKRIANGEDGYGWLYKALAYSEKLGIKEFQDFFDRAELNQEYKSQYNKEGKERDPYSWLQAEINLIYSFHKCFAMRNHTRVQCYRNDLSQKGVRTKSTINIGLGKFLYKRDQAKEQR